MPPITIQPSFTAGELTPSLHARVDLAKYAVGLKTCRNFFIAAHGGAYNRPGTMLVGEVADSDYRHRLITFQFNTTQTYVLEFGHLTLRVIKDGGYVLDGGGAVYEIASPYSASDLPRLKFTQSADVMTLMHPSYAPRELRRTGHAAWAFSTISFAPSILPPPGLALSTTHAGVAATQETYWYVVTTVDDNGEESRPSPQSSIVSLKLGVAANTTSPYEYPKISIGWGAVTGATRYKVYKTTNQGVYGYIGSTTAISFVDTNISPDYANGPPDGLSPFTGANNYPQCVTYHQQRRVFAGSNNEPGTVRTTQTGYLSNLDKSVPSRDDDAITFTLAARQVNEIRHLVPLTALIALTSGGIWTIKGGDGKDAITPSSIEATMQTARGASHVPPLTVGSTVLYVQDKGSVVQDLGYQWESDSYSGNDLSVMAAHLFRGHEIEEWAYAEVPFSLVWAVRSDGTLLGLTYLREHQVVGWHRHDTTNGVFESVACISEGDEDAVYVIVKRTLNGATKRFVERMASRVVTDQSDWFFVDCGLTYDGAPATEISGLDHLEGEAVAVLADGDVVQGLTVSGGSITLPRAASKVHVGLPIQADLESLKVEIGQVGTIQGRRQRVVGVTVRCEETGGLHVGPDADHLTPMRWEGYTSPTTLRTGDYDARIDSVWSSNSQIFLRQDYPLPAGILALIPEVDFER
jgi:hypothetical protein